MAELQELFSRDTDIENDQNSWTSQPAGFLLLIEESPEYYLLIEDDGDKLLIG